MARYGTPKNRIDLLLEAEQVRTIDVLRELAPYGRPSRAEFIRRALDSYVDDLLRADPDLNAEVRRRLARRGVVNLRSVESNNG